jgi:hypothetical protein
MTTTQAAQEVPDDSLDFIYVDARQAPSPLVHPGHACLPAVHAALFMQCEVGLESEVLMP